MPRKSDLYATKQKSSVCGAINVDGAGINKLSSEHDAAVYPGGNPLRKGLCPGLDVMSSLRVFLLLALFLHLLPGTVVRAQSLGIQPPYVSDIPQTTLAGGTLIERIWQDLQEQKNALLPVSLGGWHWWRVRAGDPAVAGFGSHSYFYFLVDPVWQTGGRFWQSTGLHSDLRLQSPGTYRGAAASSFWSFETYAWASTPLGVFKAGQIRRRLGLDWDGSFFGQMAYYDGLKLNADLGVSWERAFVMDAGLSIEAVAQFFFREDGISGSVPGGDSETNSLLRLQNTGVLRVVPTWWFGKTSCLALGLTSALGQVKAQAPGFEDHLWSAWGADLTFTRGRFKAFAEVLQTRGALTPLRHVSGGMSSRITNVLAGFSYTTGPVSWRATWSAGFDHAPSGHQQMLVPGVTIAITPDVDLYLEYVRWDVSPRGGPTVSNENGFQFALNWRF